MTTNNGTASARTNNGSASTRTNNVRTNSFQDPINVNATKRRPVHFSTVYFKILGREMKDFMFDEEYAKLIARIEENQKLLFQKRQNLTNNDDVFSNKVKKIRELEQIIYGDRVLVENIIHLYTQNKQIFKRIKGLKKDLNGALSIQENKLNNLYKYHENRNIPNHMTNTKTD